MELDKVLLGPRWRDLRVRRQFGFEEIGGALSEIPTDEVIADVADVAVQAVDMPWGAGAQDAIEASLPGSEPVSTGTWDAASLSDRLRAIAAGTVEAGSREGAIAGTPGGQAYDPSLSFGTMDWSRVLQQTPQAVTALSQVVSTVARTVRDLAGVNARSPAGNPAPGGRPSPGLLQRIFGGAPAGTVTAPAGGRLGGIDSGTLLTFGVIAGMGWLFLRKRA